MFFSSPRRVTFQMLLRAQFDVEEQILNLFTRQVGC